MYYKNSIITVCNFKKLKISEFATPSGSQRNESVKWLVFSDLTDCYFQQSQYWCGCPDYLTSAF